MALRYKIDILAALKEAGYSTYKIKQEKVFNETIVQQFRSGIIVNWKQIEKLCAMLSCQPGDLIEYKECEDEGGAVHE